MLFPVPFGLTVRSEKFDYRTQRKLFSWEREQREKESQSPGVGISKSEVCRGGEGKKPKLFVGKIFSLLTSSAGKAGAGNSLLKIYSTCNSKTLLTQVKLVIKRRKKKPLN